MLSSCERCGGCVIGERVSDYYQARHWRCINCGWFRDDVQVRSGQPICASKRGAYQSRA